MPTVFEDHENPCPGAIVARRTELAPSSRWNKCLPMYASSTRPVAIESHRALHATVAALLNELGPAA
jgi:hypothetical protein